MAEQGFVERNHRWLKIVGIILVIIGLGTLLIFFDDANSPTGALGDGENLGQNITNIWFEFAYVVVLVLGGLALIQKKIKMNVMIWTALAIFVALFISSTIGTYNALVVLEQNIKKQVGDIKVTYQLRLDTVPDLLSAAREPLAQEVDIQNKLTAARQEFASANDANSVVGSANSFEQALGRIVVLSEAYPTLRDSSEFQFAQKSIQSTGEKLATERSQYNTDVENYNTMSKTFPMSLFHKVFGFTEYSYWSDLTEKI